MATKKKTPLKKTASKPAAKTGAVKKPKSASEKKPAPDIIYQLKITLQGIRPSVWRRVLVNPDVTFFDLHKIIQTLMGWWNSHLHVFESDCGAFAPVEYELDFAIDSRMVRLNEALSGRGQRLIYEYDLGDGWRHDVRLEKILPNDKTVSLPLCTGGARACPPEDCGGAEGYARMLRILKNPDHEEYGSFIEWLGGGFDPDFFDAEEVNSELRLPDYGCITLS